MLLSKMIMIFSIVPFGIKASQVLAQAIRSLYLRITHLECRKAAS